LTISILETARANGKFSTTVLSNVISKLTALTTRNAKNEKMKNEISLNVFEIVNG